MLKILSSQLRHAQYFRPRRFPNEDAAREAMPKFYVKTDSSDPHEPNDPYGIEEAIHVAKSTPGAWVEDEHGIDIWRPESQPISDLKPPRHDPAW